MRPRVVLIGPPGSGKTSVGEALAVRWGMDHRDTDAEVERVAGKSVSDIFVDEGEAVFRAFEGTAVSSALAAHHGILSLGGGAILDPTTRSLLHAYVAEGGTVVFLDVSLTAVVPRVGLNAVRPLLVGNPRRQWLDLMGARRALYEELATVTVLTDDIDAQEVARQIDALEVR